MEISCSYFFENSEKSECFFNWITRNSQPSADSSKSMTFIQSWAERNYKRKAQFSQPPQLRKLRCALFFYFESLRKLRCGLKFLKFVAL